MSEKRNHPIICTACGHPFRTFRDWQEHRAVIKSWEMARYNGHTRRCLTPKEWALMVLAECQGIQEQAQSHSESYVHAREGITV